MAFFKEKITRKQVNFGELLEKKEKLVILFPRDIEKQYKLLRMCSGWRNVFDRFVFIMPEEELDFYGNLTSFSHFDMVGYNTENINFHNALIFDFSGKKDFKDRLNSARNSIIASPDNIGNIRFLPPVTDADELLEKFCTFFKIDVTEDELDFDFSNVDIALHNNEFYSNKFMNFTIYVDKDFSLDKVKELVIIIKQNFPANCYLVGKELKKHEFINFKNLNFGNLMDLFKIAVNSDIFLNTSDIAARIFSKTEVKQIYMGRLPLSEKVNYINPVNLTNLANKISTIIDKE